MDHDPIIKTFPGSNLKLEHLSLIRKQQAFVWNASN